MGAILSVPVTGIITLVAFMHHPMQQKVTSPMTTVCTAEPHIINSLVAMKQHLTAMIATLQHLRFGYLHFQSYSALVVQYLMAAYKTW